VDSTSAPHLLRKGLLVSPTKWRCFLRVLCPLRRQITTLGCVLLKNNHLVFVVGLGREISFRACQYVLLRTFFFLFLLLSKSPVNEPPLQVSQCGTYGERFPFPEPSFTYPSGSPVKELSLHVPLTELPLSETLHFQSPLYCLSKSLGKGVPLHVPQRGPCGDRCTVSGVIGLFIHLYLFIYLRFPS